MWYIKGCRQHWNYTQHTHIHTCTHTQKKTCFVSSYCCGKGRCNTKYSKLLDLSSSDYTPVQGSFGPHYTHQCATYKNATICSLILLNGMQMIKQTVVLEKKKKALCPLFALLLQRQQHIVIQNVAILARSVLSWTEASSLQLQFTFQDMIVPCSRLWQSLVTCSVSSCSQVAGPIYIMALCLAATKTRRLLKPMTMHSTDT